MYVCGAVVLFVSRLCSWSIFVLGISHHQDCAYFAYKYHHDNVFFIYFEGGGGVKLNLIPEQLFVGWSTLPCTIGAASFSSRCRFRGGVELWTL